MNFGESASRIVFLALAVFAVAAITALVLTLTQGVPHIPIFSDIFMPNTATPQEVRLQKERENLYEKLSTEEAAPAASAQSTTTDALHEALKDIPAMTEAQSAALRAKLEAVQ